MGIAVSTRGGPGMITARGLARTFRSRRGNVEAVRGVDLDVAEREIVGFLGPNGAGKTTTLRMLTTLLEPTAGEATVAGRDLRLDPVGVRRRIGYVSQSGSTYPEARSGEEIVDHARLYGLHPSDARRRGHELFEQLDLAGLWDRQTKTLSGGQRRRLDIAMGLIHDPVLVFLDEADALCDRILVIDDGRIVAEGTPDELKRGVSGDAVALEVADPAQLALAVATVSAVDGVTDHAADGVAIRFRVPDGAAALPALLRALDGAGV